MTTGQERAAAREGVKQACQELLYAKTPIVTPRDRPRNEARMEARREAEYASDRAFNAVRLKTCSRLLGLWPVARVRKANRNPSGHAVRVREATS